MWIEGKHGCSQKTMVDLTAFNEHLEYKPSYFEYYIKDMLLQTKECDKDDTDI